MVSRPQGIAVRKSKLTSPITYYKINKHEQLASPIHQVTVYIQILGSENTNMYTCKNEFIQHTILNKYNFGDIAITKVQY